MYMQTPRKLLGFHWTEDRFWPDFADIKHDYTQEFYRSYTSFISQCPRTSKFRSVWYMWFYNKNPCAWLPWHWSSRGQLALCNPRGRVGSKFNWPSENQCQRSHSKWVFVFIPHLKSKYSQLIVSKLSRKAAICPRRSPWRLIVLVRSLRSARLHTAWLVKSVTYFNLIG